MFNSIKMPLIVIMSYFFALVLAILPLPSWADWFRPEWVVLVMIYWSSMISSKISVGVAWVVGLLLDILFNMPLGQNALALVLVTYFTVKFHTRMPFFTFGQKLLVMFGLTLFFQLVLLFLSEAGFLYYSLLICISRSIVSTIIWLWLAFFLSGYQHRFDLESYHP